MDEAAADVMDQLAGLSSGSSVTELRRQRPEVVRHMQGSDVAIFAPKGDGGLSPGERAAAALRIATLLRDETLQDHYGARLASLDPNGGLRRTIEGDAQAGDARWQTVLAHVDRVTTGPDSATRADIDGLLAAGLSPHAVVALSELIAYVNFQSRVLAGLRMLRDAR
jgi:CMD domain protein